LARALNTTPDFILHGGQSARNEAAGAQAELVGIWRKLSKQHQDTLLHTARGLLAAEHLSCKKVGPTPGNSR